LYLTRSTKSLFKQQQSAPPARRKRSTEEDEKSSAIATVTGKIRQGGGRTKANTKTAPVGKREILLRLTSRKNGASLEELMAALDWQKHSVRGFIATLGKTMSIDSFETEKGVRTYKTLQTG
jgi:hypothetical protein